MSENSQLDDEHCAIKYKKHDRSFELKGEHKKYNSILHTKWTKLETNELQNFIAEKSNQTRVPLDIPNLSREFIEKSGICRTEDAVMLSIHEHLFPNISKLEDFGTETRMRMLFALSAPIDKTFLNELRKKASIKIDEKRRIIEYKENDGSLELKGDHSRESEFGTWYASQQCNGGFSDDSEIDEKEKEKHFDKEDEKDTINRDTTRSGRLSKRRYPEDKSFCDSNDSNDNASKSSKNEKNDSTSQILIGRYSSNSSSSETDDEESEEEYKEEQKCKAKKTTRRRKKVSKKLVGTTSDSSQKDPRAKNQKRNIVENPSVATSSSSKSKQIRRVTDTQNDTKSDKIANGTNLNDDIEVIYDGPGEPTRSAKLPIKQKSLSHKEVKLEIEEIKPDRSLLSSTTNMHNFSGTKGTCTDDVNRSSENTDEMTSGKDFMKLLHSLVDILDSSILAEFQSRIEKAIEKLGDGDHSIPIDEIVMSLNTGLFILNKNSTMVSATGESTSLRDFLIILRSTLSIFNSPSLSNFQLKLKETIKKLNGQDKIIPIESIRPVLETVLLLAVP